MKLFSIQKERIYVDTYKGFFSESNIRNMWLGDYWDVKIFLRFLGLKIKTIHWYRLKKDYKKVFKRKLPVAPTIEELEVFYKGYYEHLNIWRFYKSIIS